jgi:hypothetical protein
MTMPMNQEPQRTVPKLPLAARIARVVAAVAALAAIVVGILIFIGRDALPHCDSRSARQTLATIFRENNVAHTGFGTIGEVSRSDTEMRCTAIVDLADGGTLDVAYRVLREDGRNMVRATWTRRSTP